MTRHVSQGGAGHASRPDGQNRDSETAGERCTRTWEFEVKRACEKPSPFRANILLLTRRTELCRNYTSLHATVNRGNREVRWKAIHVPQKTAKSCSCKGHLNSWQNTSSWFPLTATATSGATGGMGTTKQDTTNSPQISELRSFKP